LDILGIESAARGSRVIEVCRSNESGQDEGNGGKEAEGALDSVEGVVHDGRRASPWNGPQEKQLLWRLAKSGILTGTVLSASLWTKMSGEQRDKSEGIVDELDTVV
jgi:hypothetical protein